MNSIMRHLLNILIIALFCCTSQVASAQKKIDDLVNNLEKNRNVNTVYSEKRDPKTKKITRCTKVLTLPGGFQISKAQKVFESERKNAVEATKREGGIYILRFQDDKSTRLYKLIPSQNNEKCIISIDIKATNNKKGKKNDKGEPQNNSNWIFDFSVLDDLDDLDELQGLRELGVDIHLDKDSIKKLKTNVAKSLGNIGNVVKSECLDLIENNGIIRIYVTDNGDTTISTMDI